MNSALQNQPAPLIQQARAFSALGDVDRLRVLTLIAAGGEVCNCHLEKITGFLPSKISRHLGQLKGAGWITGRRHGTWIYYSLSQETKEGWLKPLLAELAENDPTLIPQIQEAGRVGGAGDTTATGALEAHLL